LTANNSSLSRCTQAVNNSDPIRVFGKVTEITGVLLKAVGIKPSVGEACRIYPEGQGVVEAEVVGFRDGKVLLMAIGELSGIRPGSRVLALGKKVSIVVGPELMGRVINENGVPIDGKGPIRGVDYPIFSTAPNPLEKERIREPLDLGISALNALLTCGKGQRIGIMAGAGVGKSVLLGMMAKYTSADVNVIALVGERGREVREFIERDLQESGLKRSVVVVTTSEQSPVSKVKCAVAATAVAEYFRGLGNDVLLFMDSLTRVAMAQREIGLAVGEPPTTKGYTPSVFALFPKLLERAGTAFGKGSITGFYTVLVEGDDLTDPVADAVMSILDGHIVLSRELAMENHYPAIDVMRSVSRVMPDVVDDRHMKLSGKFLAAMAVYKRFEDMINLGAYKQGSNPKVDYAISMVEKFDSFLKQGMNEKRDFEASLKGLSDLFGGA
jgi:flagellum-specific ATP synthase